MKNYQKPLLTVETLVADEAFAVGSIIFDDVSGEGGVYDDEDGE